MSKPTCADARKGKGYYDSDGDTCCAACDRLLDEAQCEWCGGFGERLGEPGYCRNCGGKGRVSYCANAACPTGTVSVILEARP